MFNQQDHLQWSKSQLTLYSPPLSIGKPMCFTSAFCHLHCNVLSGVTEQSDIYMIYEVSRRKKTFLSCEYIFFNSLNYLNQPRWRALILLLRNSRCPRHKTKCQSVCLCMHIHKMITAQVSPWRSGGEGVKFTLSLLVGRRNENQKLSTHVNSCTQNCCVKTELEDDGKYFCHNNDFQG